VNSIVERSSVVKWLENFPVTRKLKVQRHPTQCLDVLKVVVHGAQGDPRSRRYVLGRGTKLAFFDECEKSFEHPKTSPLAASSASIDLFWQRGL